jgi:hypothetical protein
MEDKRKYKGEPTRLIRILGENNFTWKKAITILCLPPLLILSIGYLAFTIDNSKNSNTKEKQTRQMISKEQQMKRIQQLKQGSINRKEEIKKEIRFETSKINRFLKGYSPARKKQIMLDPKQLAHHKERLRVLRLELKKLE